MELKDFNKGDAITITFVDGTTLPGTFVSVNSKGLNIKATDGKVVSRALSKIDRVDNYSTPDTAADLFTDGETYGAAALAAALDMNAKALRVQLRALGIGVGRGPPDRRHDEGDRRIVTAGGSCPRPRPGTAVRLRHGGLGMGHHTEEEHMSRRMSRTARMVRWFRSPSGQRLSHLTPALGVFAVAAYQSYWHQVEVALKAGETAVSSHMMPISVDGMMIVAARYVTHAKTRTGRVIAFMAFGIGVVATLAANLMAANPTMFSRAVAVAPAVAMVSTACVMHWGERKAKATPRRRTTTPANVAPLRRSA